MGAPDIIRFQKADNTIGVPYRGYLGSRHNKRAKEDAKEAKVAFLEDGNIYIEPLGRKAINDLRL